MKTAFVTPGFKSNLMKVMEDETASFERLARLLTFQPSVIALLFEAAVNVCNDLRYSILKRPQSVQGIINILGFNGVLNKMEFICDAPILKQQELWQMCFDTYELSCVLSRLAEIDLGRMQAQNFFLYGCLFGVGNQNLIDIFNESTEFSCNLSISEDAEIPIPKVALNLVHHFRKHKRNSGFVLSARDIPGYKDIFHRQKILFNLYENWLCAEREIRFTLSRIEENREPHPVYSS